MVAPRFAGVGGFGFALFVLAACGDAHVESTRSLRGILGQSGDDSGFETADRVVDFSFPADHGPHPEFRSEWWYLTAVLEDADGRAFGAQFTLFRHGIEPRTADPVPTDGAEAWRTGQIYMAHFAVSDVAERRHMEAERLARGHPALAGVGSAPFAANLEGWRLESSDTDFWPLRLAANTRDFEVHLVLNDTKPVVLQGEAGLSRKGPDNASYYYSIPRIRAEGAVRIGADWHDVTGLAWLDREWSTSVLAPEYQGWDWFAVSFDDGRDLMLFRLRRFDGRRDAYDAGSLVAVNGESRTLAASDYELTVSERWRGWPVGWNLTLGGKSPQRYAIRAVFEDQVMETSVRYWEGVVEVRGADGNEVGKGYMELTGYAQ